MKTKEKISWKPKGLVNPYPQFDEHFRDIAFELGVESVIDELRANPFWSTYRMNIDNKIVKGKLVFIPDDE